MTPVDIYGVIFIDHLEETATELRRLHVGEVAVEVCCALEISGHGAGWEPREKCRAADNVESQVGKSYVSKVKIPWSLRVNGGRAVHFDGSSALRS